MRGSWLVSKLRYPFSHFYLVIAAHGQNALEHSILSTRTDMYNMRMRIKTRGVKVEVRWKWKSDGSGSAMEVAVNDPIGPSYFRLFSRHISRTQSPKSPHYFSCPCSTEAVGIAHKPPRI